MGKIIKLETVHRHFLYRLLQLLRWATNILLTYLTAKLNADASVYKIFLKVTSRRNYRFSRYLDLQEFCCSLMKTDCVIWLMNNYPITDTIKPLLVVFVSE